MRKALIPLLLLLVGCVSRPTPDPAVMRESSPPWDAPRDAISHIEASGLEERPIGEDTNPWILALTVEYAGHPVEVPAMIGVDRLRAIQAVVHTHEVGGDVWLEGPGQEQVTLAHLFMLWGVRLTDDCLADRCGKLEVLVDGELAGQPTAVTLRGHQSVVVRAG